MLIVSLALKHLKRGNHMKNTTPAIAAAGVALLLMSACGSDDEGQPADAEQEDTASEDVTEEAEDAGDPILDEREFTGRMEGDVDAEIGEAVEIDEGAFEDHGDYVGTVTLESVESATSCTSLVGEHESRNGTYLFATFTIDVDEDAEGAFDFTDAGWRWEDFDDHVVHGDTFSCKDEANGLLDPIEPGETGERIEVFDVPEEAGYLIYRETTHDVTWDLN